MSENFKLESSSVYEIVGDSVDFCEICYKGVMSGKLVQCKCGHIFCGDCFSEYYSESLSNFKIDPFKCPVEGCEKDISKAAGQFLDEDAYSRFQTLRRRHRNLKNPKVRWCPVVNCDGFGMIDDNSTQKVLCNNCSIEITSTRDPLTSEIVESFSVAECPGCGCLIEKTFGCMKAQCYCGTDFCMKCGKFESPSHSYWLCLASDKQDNISIWVLLLSIFSQVLVPFFPVLVLMIYRNNWDKNYVRVINEHPVFYTGLIFVFSPMIFVFSLFFLPFVWAWMCLGCLFDSPKASKNVFLWLFKVVLYLGVVLLIFVGFLLALGLLIALLPLYGFGLLGYSLFMEKNKN